MFGSCSDYGRIVFRSNRDLAFCCCCIFCCAMSSSLFRDLHCRSGGVFCGLSVWCTVGVRHETVARMVFCKVRQFGGYSLVFTCNTRRLLRCHRCGKILYNSMLQSFASCSQVSLSDCVLHLKGRNRVREWTFHVMSALFMGSIEG